MPSNVTNFLGLYVMSLAIGIVAAYFNYETAAIQAAAVGGGKFVIIVQAIVIAVFFGLVAAAAWGRQNWARWVLLIFFILGLPFLALGFRQLLDAGSFQTGAALVQTVLQGLAMVFVFTGNAKAWFNKEKKA